MCGSKDEMIERTAAGDDAAGGPVDVPHPPRSNANEKNGEKKDDGGDGDDLLDPLLQADPLPPVVRENDHVILSFGDGRQIFAHCVKSWRGKTPPVKINKRSYPTAGLIGLPYGTVLELGRNGLVPLPEGEDVVPDADAAMASVVSSSGAAAPSQPLEDEEAGGGGEDSEDGEGTATSDGGGGSAADDVAAATTGEAAAPVAAGGGGSSRAEVDVHSTADNRHLVDDNTSQTLKQAHIVDLLETGAHGSTIVAALIENSATFQSKTKYSQAKYVQRKVMKYQPRCRIVRTCPYTVCEALYQKDHRKLLNMREDTLAQILSYSNVSAGCRVLVFEGCMGVITAALAHRMGGYGQILSVYTTQQPGYLDVVDRMNLTFMERYSIWWVHSGEVFGDNGDGEGGAGEGATTTAEDGAKPGEEKEAEVVDYEKRDREAIAWPCPLQEHTRSYLERMPTDKERKVFLAKRSARMARKLTRPTLLETREFVASCKGGNSGNGNGNYGASGGRRQCDSLIIATRYDPTETLIKLLPYLAPSCPFVVFHEYLEPLADTFRELQRRGPGLAINLRLSDTWMREYQVLPGRTHPNMNMSQNGGFILTGVKLCPRTGKNELEEGLLKELRAKVGGRRGKKPKNKRKKGVAADAEAGNWRKRAKTAR